MGKEYGLLKLHFEEGFTNVCFNHGLKNVDRHKVIDFESLVTERVPVYIVDDICRIDNFMPEDAFGYLFSADFRLCDFMFDCFSTPKGRFYSSLFTECSIYPGDLRLYLVFDGPECNILQFMVIDTKVFMSGQKKDIDKDSSEQSESEEDYSNLCYCDRVVKMAKSRHKANLYECVIGESEHHGYTEATLYMDYNKNNGHYALFAEALGDDKDGVYVGIKYCPFCGRKL